ncbi:hypothetical protein CONPUDRAFT_79340 [Coniophora puteana RWD-64-598 SS2]|uniref:Uncharacterized protein n=1 Tax=Coniophora puteana (strain RWD-64-598) TaxID=741705 RepID=A0A5M3N8L4_CONPW|nr:uncharacterized protein CONPUDRAFT_79340 [Coniophora puteana RWD-64-598 SS2]EIW87185.1 hypothetical protein CONPUDRAFT_79340 [Coniophora puteana RWD-64-598 SS2]
MTQFQWLSHLGEQSSCRRCEFLQLFKFPTRPQDYPESLAPLLTWIHSLPRSYFLVKVLLSLLRLANASPGTTVCIGLARHFATSVPSLSSCGHPDTAQRF